MIALACVPADDWRAQGEHRPGILGVAQIAQHQLMAVDDTGRGGEEGGRAVEMGLQVERCRLR